MRERARGDARIDLGGAGQRRAEFAGGHAGVVEIAARKRGKAAAVGGARAGGLADAG